MDDHRLIEKVLSALEAKLNDPAAAEFPADFVEQALAFFVEFADGNHHYKEEEALFPALSQRGVAVEGGPIGMMLYEHTVGRKCLAGVRENLEAARQGRVEAQSAVRRYASEYVQVLRQHIWKEDNVLFPMARQVLDPQAAGDMLARFHDETNPRTALALRERHQAFARSL